MPIYSTYTYAISHLVQFRCSPVSEDSFPFSLGTWGSLWGIRGQLVRHQAIACKTTVGSLWGSRGKLVRLLRQWCLFLLQWKFRFSSPSLKGQCHEEFSFFFYLSIDRSRGLEFAYIFSLQTHGNTLGRIFSFFRLKFQVSVDIIRQTILFLKHSLRFSRCHKKVNGYALTLYIIYLV